MADSSNKNYSPFFPLLVVVICIAMAYLLISPYITEIRQINAQIAAKKEEISVMEKKIEDLKYLQQKFSQSPDSLKFLEVAFPDQAKFEEFLVQISNMADNASISLVAFKPTNKLTNAGIEAEIDVNGNYENLILFLEYLEKNCRLVSVKSINVSSKKTEGLEGLVSAKITADILEVTDKSSQNKESQEEKKNDKL